MRNTDPFDDHEEDCVNNDDDDGFYIDPQDNSPLGPEGCLFPGECCMPGPHYESECHTADMLIEQMQQNEQQRRRWKHANRATSHT